MQVKIICNQYFPLVTSGHNSGIGVNGVTLCYTFHKCLEWWIFLAPPLPWHHTDNAAC